MSREQITDLKYKDPLEKNDLDLNKSKKVNINILLKKVRASKRKEYIEGNIFFGLIVVVVFITGFIVSL